MSAIALMNCLTVSGIAVFTGSEGYLCAQGGHLCVCDRAGKPTTFCLKPECAGAFEIGQKVSSPYAVLIYHQTHRPQTNSAISSGVAKKSEQIDFCIALHHFLLYSRFVQFIIDAGAPIVKLLSARQISHENR